MPELEEKGVLTILYGSMLAISCKVYSRWVRAKGSLAAEELVIPIERGSVTTHLILSVVCQARAKHGPHPGRLRSHAQEPPEDRLSVFLGEQARDSNPSPRA
ncbi:MAG TPA: P27 family phage terminase small subunit [Isosphaeraceae bacterium]|nr:P27 family phage terminase small subunit [Isosphaeraceae bacterium]